MQHLEVSRAVRYIYIYVIRRLKDSSFYRFYHRIRPSCEHESSLPFQKSIATCCMGGNGLSGLTSAVWQRADTY